MPEKITAENFLNNLVGSIAENVPSNLVETLAENMPKQKSGSFFQQDDSASTRFNRLFGQKRPVHNLLGGGKSADVLLWRNKKISASVLTGATVVWILFEWLNYHLLTLVFFGLVLGLLAEFVWVNASGFINRSERKVPRLVIPDEIFVQSAEYAGALLNQALGFLQDVACGGNLKQFLLVVASLFAAAVIGSWCNFLTLVYLGFVAAHTLPVFYEKYEDQVDGFLDNFIGQMQHQSRRVNMSGFLNRIPKGRKRE
ncbi:reticulon-like protein B8 [Rutidosis leptorrhynchoides]|uniref:reticulon-like protein B8 n=1 Tax=Rutidosis leptorrhynchoides TaxID=125765 RepID=UPI003A992E0D